MKRIIKFWKIIILDTIGVALMITALLIGWLPGPGGIPLFIVGLSILAIHHDWAEELIDKAKDIAENMGDKIFTNNKSVQLKYDAISPLLLIIGLSILLLQTAVWHITIGAFLVITSVTLFLGNRKRFKRIKALFKHKD